MDDADCKAVFPQRRKGAKKELFDQSLRPRPLVGHTFFWCSLCLFVLNEEAFEF